MIALAAENGGDLARPGKKDPVDPMVWLAARPGEPSWPSEFGPGRPGWHVECAAIATHYLGRTFDVQAGGRDLIFPHHEMSAVARAGRARRHRRGAVRPPLRACRDGPASTARRCRSRAATWCSSRSCWRRATTRWPCGWRSSPTTTGPTGTGPTRLLGGRDGPAGDLAGGRSGGDGACRRHERGGTGGPGIRERIADDLDAPGAPGCRRRMGGGGCWPADGSGALVRGRSTPCSESGCSRRRRPGARGVRRAAAGADVPVCGSIAAAA